MNIESVDKDLNETPSSEPNLYDLGIREEESETIESTIADQTEQEVQEREDPRLKEGGGGFRGVVKEVQSALSGGLQDTASSLATFPERTVDMFSG